MKRTSTVDPPIPSEQYQAVLKELFRIREELQNIQSSRGLPQTSIPRDIEPVIVDPEPISDPAVQEENVEIINEPEQPLPPEDTADSSIPSFMVMTASGPIVPLDKYMELHAKVVTTTDENQRLKRKLAILQENVHQLTDKKASAKEKLKGENLKNAFVDLILNSDLNIEAIPDDVEREIYNFILTQVSVSTSFLKRLFTCS